MNAKRRWYELLLTCTTVLLILVSGNLQTANAQYTYIQSDWEPYEYKSDYYHDGESTWVEHEEATTSTDSGGAYECDCTAKAYAKANDDSADADADSQAYWSTDWTWSGPPGYAPGGELAWTQIAGGSSTAAWGYNPTSGLSASSARASSWSVGTEGSAYADIYVWGYIDDGAISGDWDTSASPPGALTLDDEDSSNTSTDYSYWEDGWSFYTYDTETIASGTTYIYFAGGITCDVATSTISSEQTTYMAEAHGEAIAYNDIYADFDW